MGFVTKLDYSNNRQIRQRVETETQLSGGTTFGVPYSELVRGVDEDTIQLTSTSTGVTSTFSGNTGTTIFFFGDYNMELGGDDLEPITSANSGITQTAGPAFTGATFTTVDDNLVTLTYSGVGYNLIVTNFEEVTAGNYTGTTISDLNFYSGDTADYTGNTVWITSEDSVRVKGILYANIIQANQISANISGITDNFITGATWNPNDLELTNNTGGTINVTIDTFDDLTVNNTLSADTVDATTFLSGGTNITDIVNGDNTFTTGATLISDTLSFDRNDILSAYTVSLSGLTTDLQQTYNNSLTPQIVTTVNSGALQIQGGSGSDDDSIIEGLNGGGTSTFQIKGEGALLLGTNHILGTGSTTSILVGGDDNELTDGFHNGIIGGNQNLIQGGSNLTTILGGFNNTITGSTYSSLLGTTDSTMVAVGSVIAGGSSNVMFCVDSGILGGTNNTINSLGGGNAIIGGGGNSINSGVFNSVILGASGIVSSANNTTYTEHLKTNGFDLSQTSKGYEGLDSLGNEIYSLRNDGSVVYKSNGSAISDIELFNNSMSIYVDGSELKARGKDNLGIGYDVKIGGNTPSVTTDVTLTNLSVNSDITDSAVVTTLATTLTIANPTGTPEQTQKLMIRLRDDGTARSLIWGGIFRPMADALPTTTVPNKYMYLGFAYNQTDNRWDLIALNNEV